MAILNLTSQILSLDVRQAQTAAGFSVYKHLESTTPAELVSLFAQLGMEENDAYLYKQWVCNGIWRVTPSEGQDFLDMFERLDERVPQEHKDILPQEAYRGLVITKVLLQKIREGSSLPLKPKTLTSWTADRLEARKYAESSKETMIGVVLAADRPKQNAVIYLGSKLQNFLTKKAKVKRSWHVNKNEVIMRGNGFQAVSLKSIGEIVPSTSDV